MPSITFSITKCIGEKILCASILFHCIYVFFFGFCFFIVFRFYVIKLWIYGIFLLFLEQVFWKIELEIPLIFFWKYISEVLNMFPKRFKVANSKYFKCLGLEGTFEHKSIYVYICMIYRGHLHCRMKID